MMINKDANEAMLMRVRRATDLLPRSDRAANP
jgi:hypothetical protein